MKTKEQRELEDAQYDAERYRDEVEHLRRRENERQAEQEHQRKQDRERLNPSNRLYNGDVGDFREAVECRILCCEREIVPVVTELDEKSNRSLRDAISDARRAEAIHDTIMRSIKSSIVKSLREAKLDDWADCYERGDYSSMAI